MCLQKSTPVSIHQSEDSGFSWRWASDVLGQGKATNSVTNDNNKNNSW